jgi:antitoxin CcdA
MRINMCKEMRMSASRRATNLSIDASVLEEARSLNVNLSRAAQNGIQQAISAEKARKWKEDNAEAIRSSNEYVEKHGLPLEEFRMF